MSEVLPITGEYLIKIFQDKKFLDGLHKVNDFYGFEALFDVMQVVNEPKYGITGVNYGDRDDMSNLVAFDKDPEVIDPYKMPFKKLRGDLYTLISLHSHEEELIPTAYNEEGRGDLTALSIIRIINHDNLGLNTRPISIVLAQTKSKRINLLLIQEKTSCPLGPASLEGVEEVFMRFHPGEKPELVAETLRNTGYYNAQIVILDGNGYSRRSLERIASFEFTPQVLDKEKLKEFL